MKNRIVCIAMGVLLLAGPAVAGGLLVYEMGTPEVGLAGAGWAARAQDAATVATNPAGMTRLGAQNELLLGSQLLYADLSFHVDRQASTFEGGGGGNPIGFFPGLSTFYSRSISPQLKMGLGIYGNLGAALDYDDQWAGRYHFTNGTLIGLTIAPTAAYKISARLSAGAGLNIMYAIFSTEAAINTPDPTLGDGRLKVEDNQWGLGGNFGLLYELSDATRFGIQYTTEISLDFKDTVAFSGLGPGLTAALRARGLLDAELGLEMTVPQTVMLSFFHHLSDTWAVMGNLGWQEWSRYGRLGVQLDAETSTRLTKNRQYEDSYHGALGLQVDLKGPWLLSCGVAYDSGIVDDATRTPDLANGDAWRFAAGARYTFRPGLELGLGYTFLWMGDMEMDLPGGPLSGRLAGTFQDTSLHFWAANLRIAF